MSEIQPDLSDKNRCVSVHWTLPVQCVLPCTHYEVWHEAWHPETGNRIRYRRVLGVYSTQSYHDGEWHGLLIPPPPAKGDAQVAQLHRQLESATASVVALSGQCERLTARCEQQERDHAETVAELERLRTELTETQRSKNEVGSWLDQTVESRRKERERAQQAEAKVYAVETLRVWKNEDGKRFLFADDVFAALRGGETA